MKKHILELILFAFVFPILIYSQEKVTNEKSLNETKLASEKMTVKDAGDNTLLEINDEGTGGSILIPALPSISITTSKLYNIGGNLYWNGTAIGTAASGGGWTDEGSYIHLTAATDNVGVGITSPSYRLDVEGDINTSSFYRIGGNKVFSIAGTMNTIVGSGAGATNTGNYCTLLGYNAGYNNDGDHNTFLGRWSGYNNSSGQRNAFVGASSGRENTGGSFNVIVGYDGGRLNTVGSSNVFLGYQAGYNETGSNKLYIDNTSTTAPLIYGDFDNNVIAINGNLGIGTTTPSSALDVSGTINATGFQMSPGASSGYVLTSNTSGVASWQAAPGGIGGGGTSNYIARFTASHTLGDSYLYQTGDNIGINTTSPDAKLHARTTNLAAIGLHGQASIGVLGTGYSPTFIYGSSGVKGESYSSGTYGALGHYVGGITPYGVGVYGYTPNVEDYAGYFVGKVRVNMFQLDASPTNGYVLKSDASGNASWQTLFSFPYSSSGTLGSTLFTITNNGLGSAIRGKNDEGTHHTLGELGTYMDGVYGKSEQADGAGVFGVTDNSNGYAMLLQNTATGLYGDYLKDFGAFYEASLEKLKVWLVHKGIQVALKAENWVDSLYTHLATNTYAFEAIGENLLAFIAKIHGGLQVLGSISKSSSFTILDHPGDPLNKLLTLTSVESPDPVTIYRGKISLNSLGEAIVKLPDYFKDLNNENEATINLTCIGRPFLTGYDWTSGNSGFAVYGEPNREVSWIVYADRDDPVMLANKFDIVEEKGPETLCERGRLLRPQAHGYPKTMSSDYEQMEKMYRENENQSSRRHRTGI